MRKIEETIYSGISNRVRKRWEVFKDNAFHSQKELYSRGIQVRSGTKLTLSNVFGDWVDPKSPGGHSKAHEYNRIAVSNILNNRRDKTSIPVI